MMNNYAAHLSAPSAAPSAAASAAVPNVRSIRQALKTVKSLTKGALGDSMQQQVAAREALNCVAGWASEIDFQSAWDRLFDATRRLPGDTPHMAAMQDFVDAGAARRMASLHKSVVRERPTRLRSHDLRVARALAELSPDATVRAQANAVAATLRHGLMPDTERVTKGSLAVPSPHPGFAAALKNTYVAPTYDGRGVKVRREVCTLSEKYLLECTTAAGAFGKVHLASTLDGRELVAKVTHVEENAKGKVYLTLDKIKASNDLLIRCGSDLAADLYLIEEKVYAFQARYSGDLFEVNAAIPYNHPLRPAIMAKAFRDIAEDVERLYTAKVVHRDLKPENMLYHPGKKMAVCDYDLAHDGLRCEMYTRNAGTSSYMAPEALIHFGQTEYTEKVDVWSVAISFFYMNALDWSNVPFQHVTDESKMIDAYNTMYNWRVARSPTQSPCGPLDWNLIEASEEPLDYAAKAFHALFPPMAEYIVENMLELGAEGRPDAGSMAAKAREIYAPYAHLEAEIDQVLQQVADQNAKAKAAALALADHVQTQLVVDALSLLQSS